MPDYFGEPQVEPQRFNPCWLFCCVWNLHMSAIFVAIFQFFFHTAISVCAFTVFFFYRGGLVNTTSKLDSPFHMACLIVGVVSAVLVLTAILLFIGVVKKNALICIIWLIITIPSTLVDVAALIVEQSLSLVIFEVFFFVIRAFNVSVIWCFVAELKYKMEMERAGESRNVEMRHDTVEMNMKHMGFEPLKVRPDDNKSMQTTLSKV